jgi:hypothetical protein
VVNQSRAKPWAFARRIFGLTWAKETDTNTNGGLVEICDFACDGGGADALSAPQQEALRQIKTMIESVPGNESVFRLFRVARLVLAHSSARSISLVNKVAELSEQLRGLLRNEAPGVVPTKSVYCLPHLPSTFDPPPLFLFCFPWLKGHPAI